jgi:hypothetical protein
MAVRHRFRPYFLITAIPGPSAFFTPKGAASAGTAHLLPLL